MLGWSFLAVGVFANPAPTSPPVQKPEAKAAPTPEAPSGLTGEKMPPSAEGAAVPEKAPQTPEKPRFLQTGSLDALFKLVPVGRTHSGVKYPVMDNGALTALVESERMTRTDENSLTFENAVIDQKGNDPMTFRLIAAVYNKASNMLMSSQPAVIESPSYRIEGDSLAYDRGSGNSRMVGRVRMMIFDTGALNGDDDAAAAKPEGTADPAKAVPAVSPPPSGNAGNANPAAK